MTMIPVLIDDDDDTGTYRIQLKGRRLDGAAKMSSSLYGDTRDEGSTYVCVHDSKYSLWRFIPLPDGRNRIQLEGSRKKVKAA